MSSKTKSGVHLNRKEQTGFLSNSPIWMGQFHRVKASCWQFHFQTMGHMFKGICFTIAFMFDSRECPKPGQVSFFARNLAHNLSLLLGYSISHQAIKKPTKKLRKGLKERKGYARIAIGSFGIKHWARGIELWIAETWSRIPRVLKNSEFIKSHNNRFTIFIIPQ